MLENAESKINMRILPAERVPFTLAANLPDDKNQLESLMLKVLSQNTDIFGMAAAFEPETFISGKRLYSPYVHYEDGETVLSYLDSEEYNYPTQSWYLEPKVKHESVWSEPYYDEGGGNVLMTTYSYPVYKSTGFLGVITADITLVELSRVISNIKILRSGYAFLISEKGMVMVHPDRNLIMNKNISDISLDDFTGIKDSSFHTETGEKLVWSKKIDSTGWTIGLVFPKNELFEPVSRMNSVLFSISIACAGLLLLLIVIISRKVTGGMHILSESAGRIAGGDFYTPLKINGGKDELAKLSQSFESMRKSLIDYIKNLKVTETAKQKIESELSIAKDIQSGLLPKIFPPFPSRNDVDIYGSMTPAKEVGGDLYDFYLIDDDVLCFIIGDVSDKGVPAALFMAVSKTLLKAVAEADINAGDIFTRVNSELADGNENCMFVTAFIGTLNLKTGDMSYANAGHNPPVIISEDGVSMVTSDVKPPLGAFENVNYDTYHLNLSTEDKLFLYTDGVTEAMNSEGVQYTEAKLLEVLEGLSEIKPEEIINTVSKSVSAHTKDAEQSDDITMLCLSRKR